MIEIGTLQAKRLIVLHPQQTAVKQLAPALGALGVAPHHEDHDVV
jgi:hypothetical protein